MPDAESFDVLGWLTAWMADSLEMLRGMLADGDLERELRAALDLPTDGAIAQLPSFSTRALSQYARGAEVGGVVERRAASFAAAQRELTEAVAAIGDAYADVVERADDLQQGFQVVEGLFSLVAVESLRSRHPRFYHVLKALGVVASVGRRAAGIDASQEDVETIDVFRSIDLFGGASSVADDDIDPTWRAQAWNFLALAAAVAGARSLDDGLDVSFGFAAEPDSATPKADAVARLALTTRYRVGAGADHGPKDLFVTVLPTTMTAPGDAFRSTSLVSLAVDGKVAHTSGKWTIELEATDASIDIVVGSRFQLSAGAADSSLVATARYGEPGDDVLTFGQPDRAQFLVGHVEFAVRIADDWSLSVKLVDVRLKVDLGRADAFVGSLTDRLEAGFDLGLVYDEGGFRFDGGVTAKPPPTNAVASIPSDRGEPRPAGAPQASTRRDHWETSVAADKALLGLLRLGQASISLDRSHDQVERLDLSARLDVGLDIGPIHLDVEQVGLRVGLSGEGSERNFVLFGLDYGYQPPLGVGVSIDTGGAVRGGGSLAFDDAEGSYRGVLDLTVGESVGVKALGLLDTTVVGGGWSLLLLVFADLGPRGVPLPLGFTLDGVGGIVGVGHRASDEAMRNAIGTSVFDDVLFPDKPVERADEVFGALLGLFPRDPAGLVVGLAFDVRWGGSRAILRARLALLLGFRGPRLERVSVIGTFSASAPPKEVDTPKLVEVTADLYGTYDVDKQLLSIDARLRDSKIAGVEVSGSLLVRVGFGRSPVFVLSAGGFHPEFRDRPPLLPAKIDRLGVCWQINEDVRLEMSAYVAITSATVQLGAAFDLTAKAGPVRLDGHLGFDVIAYEDGRFSAQIDGHVAIRYRGRSLAKVSLHLRLERSATQVWRARGTASFSIWLWDVDVDFSFSWGQERALPDLGKVDAAALVRSELGRHDNWRVALPAGSTLVGLAPAAVPDGVVRVHPLGALQFEQRLVPLDTDLEHLGGRAIVGSRKVSITSSTDVGNAPVHSTFARSTFEELDERQRLSEPAFTSLPSGRSFGAHGYSCGVGVGTALTPEVIRFDPRVRGLVAGGGRTTSRLGTTSHDEGALRWQAARSAAARSRARRDDQPGARPSGAVTVEDPDIVLVDAATLRRIDVALDENEARSWLLARRRAASLSQQLGRDVVVVAEYEVAP